MVEHKRRLQNFSRFNQSFVDAYLAEKNVKGNPIKTALAEKQNPLTEFINLSTVQDFSETERLSKRLARMGVSSRRQAEKLIAEGMVYVDGKVADSNWPVTQNSRIQVGAKTGMYTPVKENTRIWLFHKPREMVTTHYDPNGRLTVFTRLKDLGINTHVISVGRLDYLSEGLLIITNDGELARAMELPTHKIERSYSVRVFGRTFDDTKLAKIRAGTVMSGRTFGPYITEVTNRQNTNTWLHMKLFEGKNNEIRRVMRKYSLRVNRLKRTNYGPYSLELVPNPNDLQEVSITPEIRKLMYNFYRSRTVEAQNRIAIVKSELLIKNKREEERLANRQLLKQSQSQSVLEIT